MCLSVVINKFTYEYETIGIVEESEGGTQKVIKPTSKDDSGTHTYTYISEYVIDTSYSSSPSTESVSSLICSRI